MRQVQGSRAVLALAMVLATGASAQTVAALTLRAGSDSTDNYGIGATSCGQRVRVTWTYAIDVGFLCGALKLWSTTGSCGDEPGSDDVRYDDVPVLTVQASRTGTFDVVIAELPGFRNEDTPCGVTGKTVTHQVCGAISYSQMGCGYGDQKLTASSLRITYDTDPPAAPVLTEVTPLDRSAALSFTASSDASIVIAEVAGPGDAAFASMGEVLASAGSMKVLGLRNGLEYRVRLRARDLAGNTSEPSQELTVTPINTVGFWGAYLDAGGTDEAGCAAAPGLWPLLLLLWPLRRRRR